MTFNPARNSPPPYQWDQFHDLIRRAPDGSVDYKAPGGHGVVAAKLNAHLAANAYYDGTNWRRFDTTKPAALWDVQYAAGVAAFFTAPAGTGAINWGTGTAYALDTGWQTPTFATNWTNQGAAATQAGYKKDALGCVVLKGLVAKTVALALPDTIFTLPAGYRPAHTQSFAVISAAGYAAVQVNTAGAVFVLAGGSATYTSLDGIRFDPAT